MFSILMQGDANLNVAESKIRSKLIWLCGRRVDIDRNTASSEIKKIIYYGYQIRSPQISF